MGGWPTSKRHSHSGRSLWVRTAEGGAWTGIWPRPGIDILIWGRAPFQRELQMWLFATKSLVLGLQWQSMWGGVKAVDLP